MAISRPVIFGEVLFDRFEEESRLGGAPFNVAWHLRGLGVNPLFISRIGDDELGARVLAAMKRWGMDTSGVQRDPERPTGEVQVRVREGEPEYEILPDQAYDYIDLPAVAAVREHAGLGLLYHGTLALRNEVSDGTLRSLRYESELPAFVDVNLRPPWWDISKTNEILEGAACIKLNESELKQLQRDSGPNLEERALHLKERLYAEAVLVTQGDSGAFVLAAGGRHGIDAQPVEELVDTVGAGDGFSAVSIVGMLSGWPWQKTLRHAALFAARICGYRGAIREDRELYESAIQRWSDG